MNKTLYFLLFCCQFAFAQNLLPRYPLTINNLKMGDRGGLNSPQFSSADLNRDGYEDLILLEKTRFFQVFRSDSNNHLTPDDSLTRLLPDSLKVFAIFRDFNRDAIPDLFTYAKIGTDVGILAFKGHFDPQNRIYFEAFSELLKFDTQNIIYVNESDVPSIEDVDGDGDMDILAFEANGGKVQWYRNDATQPDSLRFTLADNCWGKFFDNGLRDSVQIGKPNECASSNAFLNSAKVKTAHPGASLMLFDADNDGDKDVLMGNIGFNTLNLLTNDGNPQNAYISRQNLGLLNMPTFPSAYQVNIGKNNPQIIVAPNTQNPALTTDNVWQYQYNNNKFTLLKKNFLVEDMLDLGSHAYPTPLDYNQDGKMDLLIGNGAYYTASGRDSRLHLLVQGGNGNFSLIDTNFLNFKRFATTETDNFAPTFGDLDGDEDQDMLVGVSDGSFIFVENEAGKGQKMNQWANPIVNYQNIAASAFPKPQIVDLDADSLLDIVVGDRSGRVAFFKNQGTKTMPMFPTSPTITQLGKVDVREAGDFSGFAAPFFFKNSDGKLLLLCGSESGKLKLYDQIEGSLNGTFRKVNNDFGNIKEGKRTAIAVTDFNNNQKAEIVIGNQRGGIGVFQTDFSLLTNTQNISLKNDFFSLYPTLFKDEISIKMLKNTAFSIEIYNSMGQIIFQEKRLYDENPLRLNHLSNGFYLVKIIQENLKGVKKIIKY